MPVSVPSPTPALVSPWSLHGQFASVRFTVQAEADPGLLPRLLMPFAKRDLTPDRSGWSRSTQSTARATASTSR